MIAGSETRSETWRAELREALRDGAALLEALGLRPAEVGWSEQAARDFPLLVPRPFLRRMRRGDPQDPLLRQILPIGAETEAVAGWTDDPLREGEAESGRGVLRKYRGRALVVTTGACAVHCRYCFRRAFPYDAMQAGAALEQIVRALGADRSVREVILSGGDPLTLDDRRLARFGEQVDAMPWVRRVRLHSRLPVVLPSRLTTELVAILAALPGPVLVVHANHPEEIDGEVAGALRRLGGRGVLLLNQSVLLRGVNDDASVLTALSERLFDCGVQPYYLHLMDRVRGAAHFDVPEAEAVELVRAARQRLPGYLVPRLVREVPGADSKTWIDLERGRRNIPSPHPLEVVE